MVGEVGFKILECSNYDHIASCASTLSDGGVIVFPTDTVYGIGCNPYYDEPVERIFHIKDRSEDKPLPIMGSNISDIEKICTYELSGKISGPTFLARCINYCLSLQRQ